MLSLVGFFSALWRELHKRPIATGAFSGGWQEAVLSSPALREAAVLSVQGACF